MSPTWLKAIPWSTIMSNAPLIVDGAKKLVSLVKTKSADQAQAGMAAGASPRADDGVDLARLQDLERRQVETAELLRSMAEANAELTQTLDALRNRAALSLWLSVIALAGAVAIAAWLALH